jgi:hypothetical protein
MEHESKTIAALASVTTATLTTLLLKKGLRNVWMRGTRPVRNGQARVVGRAFTLRFIPAREDQATPESWAKPMSTRGAIEAMPAGCVAFVWRLPRKSALARPITPWSRRLCPWWTAGRAGWSMACSARTCRSGAKAPPRRRPSRA